MLEEHRGPGRPKVISPEIMMKNKEEMRAMGINAFFGPADKGSSRPAFCHPGGIEKMKETVSDMKKNLDHGNVAPQQRMKYEMEMKKYENRLDDIKRGHDKAQEIYKADQDFYDKRAEELKHKIQEATPSRAEVKDRRINPHTVLKNEQAGLKKDKLEYQTLQRLRDDETNISYLQR